MLKLSKDEKAIRDASRICNTTNSELHLIGIDIIEQKSELPRKFEAIGIARFLEDDELIDQYARLLEISNVYLANIKDFADAFSTIDAAMIQNNNTFVAIEKHKGEERYVLLLTSHHVN